MLLEILAQRVDDARKLGRTVLKLVFGQNVTLQQYFGKL